MCYTPNLQLAAGGSDSITMQRKMPGKKPHLADVHTEGIKSKGNLPFKVVIPSEGLNKRDIFLKPT